MKIERNYLIGLIAGAVFLLAMAYLFTALISRPSAPTAPAVKARLTPKNAPISSQYKIPPGNGIPTYSEIEAGIKKEDTRQAMVKELMADREKRVTMVNAEARMRAQQNQPEDVNIPKDTKAKQSAANAVRWKRADPNPAAVEDVQKKGFFVR